MKRKKQESGLITQGYFDDLEVRNIDQEKRQITFVAATENGVMTWNGIEHLRMSGVNLQRYRKNPVFLDTHDRYQIGAVIGCAVEVRVEGRNLVATFEFAKTARAEDAWQLYSGGFIKAVSVGFIPDEKRTLRLMEGETDGEGDAMITGPARVVKKWMLYEISGVPVPADADAIRRMIDDWRNEEGEEKNMDFGKWCEERGFDASKLSKQQEESLRALCAADAEDADDEGAEAPAAGQPGKAPAAPAASEERKAAGTGEDAAAIEARATKAERERVAAIRKEGDGVDQATVNRCIENGLSVDEARKEFLVVLRSRSKSAGAPGNPGGESSVEKVDEEVFLRSLGAPASE